ncbi:hypothetical protein L9G15_09910 [Shewanella sp. A3A]|uniref:Uncharacterized protein n=1 Tax=Shewanella electrica TaxID=515560 RepID=A0ABT2FMY2_9GAMM|nr:hypothetical protein [Shewanella electrica]MCH1919748.1 hypothetical protein [Shewanella ferrihydritica]MCH1923762.1 hypothetical protein [Shewanella electrica]MCS4556980.1 hypothetical protein [Shewanella electrica]
MNKLRVLQLLLAALSIVGWGLAVYALLIFDEARPDRQVGYFLSRGVQVRLRWDPVATTHLEQIIWSCAAISLLSLLVNWYCASHSRMGYWFNIPLLLLISITSGLYLRFLI